MKKKITSKYDLFISDVQSKTKLFTIHMYSSTISATCITERESKAVFYILLVFRIVLIIVICLYIMYRAYIIKTNKNHRLQMNKNLFDNNQIYKPTTKSL